jgi:hypothetical protein
MLVGVHRFNFWGVIRPRKEKVRYSLVNWWRDAGIRGEVHKKRSSELRAPIHKPVANCSWMSRCAEKAGSTEWKGAALAVPKMAHKKPGFQPRSAVAKATFFVGRYFAGLKPCASTDHTALFFCSNQ